MLLKGETRHNPKNMCHISGIYFLITFEHNFYEITPYHAMRFHNVCKSQHVGLEPKFPVSMSFIDFDQGS